MESILRATRPTACKKCLPFLLNKITEAEGYLAYFKKKLDH
jgi:hypothetical protein